MLKSCAPVWQQIQLCPEAPVKKPRFWVSIVELCCAKKVFEWNSLEVAGDYGLTSLFPSDEEGQKKMRMAELKNGRLAMLAFGGAVTQAALTRHPFPWLF